MQSTEHKISVGIIGGAGYTAGELIRILLNHPNVHLNSINSESFAGQPLAHIHQDLYGETDLMFTNSSEHHEDVIFLCQGHGHSKKVLSTNHFDTNTKIIDLSNDFRLMKDSKIFDKSFVYGLPELNRNKIKTANCIANPGCFATAIQLALLPLADQQCIKHDVHIHAITGSTGAGQSPTNTTHFSWRNNNVSIYKAFDHQHLGEIDESLKSLQPGMSHDLNFIPVRGNFTRGILASVYLKSELTQQQAIELLSLIHI